MSCTITHYQPIGNPYWCGKPEYGSRDCTATKDCPRGGLGGTFEMGCRGKEQYRRDFWCQDYHVCKECVGADGCVFYICDTETHKAGYRETITEECNASDNCPDCPEYPNRPGDHGYEGNPPAFGY